MGKGKGSGWGSGWGHGLGSGDSKGKTERFWIPAMPIPVAILCCVFNFLIPGLGTAIAGLTVFCCPRPEDMEGGSKAKSCLVNCGIGFLQMLVTLLMFIGWVWSCYWGIAFIMMSVEYYKNNRVEDNDGRAAVTTTVHTTHVINANGTSAVTMQPAPTPFRVVQPNAPSGPSVVTQQPFPPTPAVQTSHGGINPSVYPPPIYHADGTVQKLEV